MSVTTRIKKLSRSTEQVARGKLETEMAGVGARDELGILTRSIADMQQKLLGDISELKRGEERLVSHNSRLAALSDIANILAMPADQSQKLSLAVEQLVQVSGADWATLRIPDELGMGLVLVANVGRTHWDTSLNRPLTLGVSGEAWRLGEAVVANDYPTHPEAEPTTVEQGAKSIVAMPVMSGERTIAIVTVVSTSLNFFTT